MYLMYWKNPEYNAAGRTAYNILLNRADTATFEHRSFQRRALFFRNKFAAEEWDYPYENYTPCKRTEFSRMTFVSCRAILADVLSNVKMRYCS